MTHDYMYHENPECGGPSDDNRSIWVDGGWVYDATSKKPKNQRRLRTQAFSIGALTRVGEPMKSPAVLSKRSRSCTWCQDPGVVPS